MKRQYAYFLTVVFFLFLGLMPTTAMAQNFVNMDNNENVITVVDSNNEYKAISPANEVKTGIEDVNNISQNEPPVVSGQQGEKISSDSDTNLESTEGTSSLEETYIRIDVEKKWKGKVPEGKVATVQLIADGVNVEGKVLTLSQENNWKFFFENLPRYNKDGTEIKYDIKEIPIKGYSSKVLKRDVIKEQAYWVMIKAPNNLEANKNYLIAVQNWIPGNKHIYYFLSDNGNEQIVGLKAFDSTNVFKSIDNGGLSAPLNFGEFSYDEYADLNEIGAVLNNENIVWLYRNTNHSKHLQNKNTSNYITLQGENKNPINYFFITSQKDGWKQHENYNWGVNYTRNLVFDSGVTDFMTKISAIQQWGYPPRDHIRQYMNLPNGQSIGRTENPDHAGNFKFFLEIKEITYSFIIENKRKSSGIPTPPTPLTKDIHVKKAWELVDNQKPVDAIEVELYKNGEPTSQKLKLNASNNWSGAFKEVPVSDFSGGAQYEYTVKEVGETKGSIKFGENHFTVRYSGSAKDGFIITNRGETPEIPIPPLTIDIKVTKVWKDHLGNEMVSPVEKIEVELYKNGEATGKKLELNAKNNWSGEFRNLETTEKAGSANYYRYTLKEVMENGNRIKIDNNLYKVQYEGNMKNGFKIINSQEIIETPRKPEEPPKPRPNHFDTPNSLSPKTGDSVNWTLYMEMMMLSISVLMLLGIKRRKENH